MFVNEKTIIYVEYDKEIDFIKIDVEGFELEVFEGGYEFIKKNQPVIYFEAFLNDQDSNLLSKKIQIAKFFQGLKYQLDLIECFTDPNIGYQSNIDLVSMSFRHRTGFEFLATPLNFLIQRGVLKI